MNQRTKSIIIFFFGLFIAIGQFSFLIATGSHIVKEINADSNTLNGNTIISLNINIFVPDNYDLYIVINDDQVDYIESWINFYSLDKDKLYSFDYKINTQTNRFIKIETSLPSGRYNITWNNAHIKCKYILTTHGLWNLYPDGRVPSDYEWFIYVLSSIMALVILGITFQSNSYIKKRSTKSFSLKADNKSKKRKVDNKSIPESVISQISEIELETTSSEVQVEEQEFICVVHKGPIIGPSYICPHCKTFYCLDCANILKEKGETCWSCHMVFN